MNAQEWIGLFLIVVAAVYFWLLGYFYGCDRTTRKYVPKLLKLLEEKEDVLLSLKAEREVSKTYVSIADRQLDVADISDNYADLRTELNKVNIFAALGVNKNELRNLLKDHDTTKARLAWVSEMLYAYWCNFPEDKRGDFDWHQPADVIATADERITKEVCTS